jgi:hypothetical protein
MNEHSSLISSKIANFSNPGGKGGAIAQSQPQKGIYTLDQYFTDPQRHRWA